MDNIERARGVDASTPKLDEPRAAGFLLPVVGCVLKCLYDRFSLCQWLNRRFNSPYTSEVYLLGGLFIAIGWLVLIEQPVFVGPLWTWPGIIIALYWTAELLVFALKWLLVDLGPVASYRRSLLCFILNLIQVAVLFTILFWLMGAYMPAVSRFDALCQSLACVFSPSFADGFRDDVPGVRVLALMQLFVAWVLVVVILGSVVGAIQRAEKHGA